MAEPEEYQEDQTMEMVEKVARAICEASGGNPNRRYEERGQSSWKYWEWNDFSKSARAAIEAMREPTPPMLRAANDCCRITGVDMPPNVYWQAMIDRALKE